MTMLALIILAPLLAGLAELVLRRAPEAFSRVIRSMWITHFLR